MNAMIYTTDIAWTVNHARTGPKPGTAVIAIPGNAERIRFAGKPFYRVDLKALYGCLRADCLNRWVAIPQVHILEGAPDA